MGIELLNTLSWMEQLNFCLRIIAAATCGSIIGYERSRRSKGAGVRTHMVIALSSALMMVISKYGFLDMLNLGFNADVSRVASQIIAGIPFLGAGVIYIRQHHSSVQGLTTAAGILATGGIGMAWGAGLYVIALFSTLLLMILQFTLHKILIGYDSTFSGEAIIIADSDFDAEEMLCREFARFSISIQKSHINRLDDGRFEFKINFKTTHDVNAKELAYIMEHNPQIASLDL